MKILLWAHLCLHHHSRPFTVVHYTIPLRQLHPLRCLPPNLTHDPSYVPQAVLIHVLLCLLHHLLFINTLPFKHCRHCLQDVSILIFFCFLRFPPLITLRVCRLLPHVHVPHATVKLTPTPLQQKTQLFIRHQTCLLRKLYYRKVSTPTPSLLITAPQTLYDAGNVL